MTPPASQSALTRHAITFIIARALAACLTLAAVVAQYSQSLAFWLAHDDNIGFRTTNFFSFFTIESNLIAMITLAIGAVLLMRGRTIDPQWFAVLRASAITYMVTTGIVYNILLRNETLSQGVTVWWSNEVLHLIVPIYMVVDWLFAPGARRVQWRTVFYVAAFPVVWVAYTMLRGPLAIDPFTGVGWYPGADGADPADPDVDGDPGLRRPVERVDQGLVDQGVHLDLHPGDLARPVVGDLAVDVLE